MVGTRLPDTVFARPAGRTARATAIDAASLDAAHLARMAAGGWVYPVAVRTARR
jgi:hypothetical protein